MTDVSSRRRPGSKLRYLQSRESNWAPARAGATNGFESHGYQTPTSLVRSDAIPGAHASIGASARQRVASTDVQPLFAAGMRALRAMAASRAKYLIVFRIANDAYLALAAVDVGNRHTVVT
jgi:hypothetical protein